MFIRRCIGAMVLEVVFIGGVFQKREYCIMFVVVAEEDTGPQQASTRGRV